MAVNKSPLSSVGGFAVNETTVVNNLRDAYNLNTLEIQNSNFSESSKKSYILKGISSTTLTLDGASATVPLANNTINFVTTRIVGVNPTGSGHYSTKIESVISCSSIGVISLLSSLETIIKDSIPSGQTWTAVVNTSAAANRYEIVTTRTGTTDAIRWFAHVDVVKVVWT